MEPAPVPVRAGAGPAPAPEPGPPGAARLHAATDVTWAPAAVLEQGPWRLRRGEGGGHRVSAATALAPEAAEPEALAAAEAAMRGWGQRPLVRIREGEAALDASLAARGYLQIEPSLLMIAPAAPLASGDPRGLGAIRSAAPLAIQREIWAAGGIGPARLAVMERSGPPRVFLLARAGDRPAAVAFAAADGAVAMLHALLVPEAFRRRGLARGLTAAAAAWAVGQGAAWLALAVTRGNAPARRLYEGMGFRVAGAYHYRALPE